MTEQQLAPILFRTEINGKEVILRRKLSAPEGQRIMRALTRAEDEGDLIAKVRVLSPLIESWQFEGAPADESTYDEIDFFEELIPLVVFLSEHIAARANRVNAAKNSVSASS